MNYVEINNAIAEIAGIVSRDQHGKLYHTEEGYVRDCPNYHGSLDAIVSVVRAMPKTCEKGDRRHRDQVSVAIELGKICFPDPACLATPAQWCEACLKVHGL